MPATMPTVAEKPSPIANAHTGRETGKPVARLTATPMPAPRRMPGMPPTDVSAAASARAAYENVPVMFSGVECVPTSRGDPSQFLADPDAAAVARRWRQRGRASFVRVIVQQAVHRHRRDAAR